jgi:hypothetical protein
METTFHISLHVKTPTGFKTYGTFDLGQDQEKAKSIFNQLEGEDAVTDKTILHLNFSKMQNGVPLPVSILHCTLDELALNVKVITREIFKNLSLENSSLGLEK